MDSAASAAEDNGVSGQAAEAPSRPLYADQVALLFQHSLLANGVTLLLSGLLVAVHWPTVSPLRLTLWLAAIWTVALTRLALVRSYRRRRPPPAEVRRWGHWYTLLAILAGLCWGAAPVVMFPTQSLEQRVFTMFVLAGMAAGSLPLLAASRIASVGFLAALTLPLAAVFAAQGSTLSLVLAVMLLVFLVGMTMTADILHRSLIRMLRLQRANEALLGEAIADKRAAEAVAADLQRAIAERGRAERKLQQANATLETRVKSRTADLQRLANHDSLTGLANRQLLGDRLDHAIAHAQRAGVELAVLFLDLDRFKPINDNLGHAVGDQVLKVVAERIRKVLRETDMAGRFGGDEFVVLVDAVDDRNLVGTLSAKIRDRIIRPIGVDGNEITLDASIGTSFYPEDGEAMEQLIEAADGRMYESKRRHRARLVRQS